MTLTREERFMRRAIDLATESALGAGGPFGAVVVRGNEILAQACNSVTADGDPTAHAEINAIREACRRLGTFRLTGCELYASCEPCPMCLGALYWAGVDRIYYSAGRHDAAEGGFSDEELYVELPKPLDQRRIPMVQLLPEAGKGPFAAWADKADRIQY